MSSSRARRPLIAATSLVLSLVAVELLLRLAAPPPRIPPPSTIDPYGENPYIVTRRPHLQKFLPGARYRAKRPSYEVDYSINAHGVRGPEIVATSSRRLVVLGDSIVEGHGVAFEDGFVARLDERLRSIGWSVVSAAMQGGSPIHYAANLPRTLSLDPDAVLIVLYENDLWDDRRNEAQYFDLPPDEDDGRSKLVALVERALGGGAGDRILEDLIRRNRDTPLPTSGPDPRTPIVVDADAFPAQWASTERYLDHVADELGTRDVPLLLATFALGTLVPRAPATHAAHARRMEESARAWAAAHDVPFLSLYDVTTNALDELPWENVLLPDDGHPTPEMHRRIADRTTPWLRRTLPGSAPCPGTQPGSGPCPGTQPGSGPCRPPAGHG